CRAALAASARSGPRAALDAKRAQHGVSMAYRAATVGSEAIPDACSGGSLGAAFRSHPDGATRSGREVASVWRAVVGWIGLAEHIQVIADGMVCAGRINRSCGRLAAGEHDSVA